jgi:hypothetical protein
MSRPQPRATQALKVAIGINPTRIGIQKALTLRHRGHLAAFHFYLRGIDRAMAMTLCRFLRLDDLFFDRLRIGLPMVGDRGICWSV